MANTENIEAKLCAYVDGELDAAGRAEIEAHLAANPQHRQLMDELRGQRDLLRDLPRATAPGDLLETVHSQLERSALLGGPGGDRSPADIAGRISPWPRIMSVAAVLAMAIGLFAVIYYVLPQNSARNREYATGVTRAPSGSAMPTTLMAERDKDLAKSKAPGTNRDRLLDLEHANKRVEDDLLARDDAGKLAGTPATRDVFAKGGPIDETKTGAGKDGHSIPSYTNIFADAQTEETVKNSAAVPSDSLLMVVASADPSQAQGEVQKYLQDNKIRWESVTEPVPQLDLKENQAMSGSRLGQTQMALKGGGSTETFAAKGGGEAGSFGGANAKQQYKAEEFGQAKKEASSSSSDVELSQQLQQQKPQPQQQQVQQEQIALAPPGSPPPSATTPNTASNAAPAPVYDLSAPASPATSAPVQQPEATSPRKSQAQQELSLQSQPQAQSDQSALQAQQPSQQPVQLQQQAAVANQSGGMPSQVIVARGLTRRQVSELNSNLYTQNAGRVKNYRRSGDNFTPTTLPATAVATAMPTPAPTIAPGAVTQGESETATVSGTPATTQPAAGPAPAPAAAAAPTPGSPARELSVNGSKSTDHFARADLGTTLPSLPATTAPLEQKHFDELAKADQPRSTTMPTGQAFGAISAPTSQPASVAATGATTMAIVATTRPASDERLDVVICIQPPGLIAGQVVELNGAAAAPATQPIIAPNAAVAPNTAATEPSAAEPSPVPNDTPPSDDAK